MCALVTLTRILLGAIAFAIVTAGSASAVAPVTVQIPIGAMAFSTAQVSVTVGDTVEWVNNDIVDHTATEKGSAWDVSMAAGKRARAVMKKAGTFDYYCRYHPNMVGRLTVSKPGKR
jgi:plastocyanin